MERRLAFGDASPTSASTTHRPLSSRFFASRRDCAVFAVAVALASVVVVIARVRMNPGIGSDLDQVWGGTRALLDGANPYTAVGPHGKYMLWGFPLYYPLPALLAFVPFAWLPLLAARACFVGVSAGLLAYGVGRHAPDQWPLFLSGGYLMAVTAAQWEPLATAAVLLPWLGWAYVAKPTVGAALWAARPRLAPVIGGLLLVAASLIVRPSWPQDWLVNIRTSPHFHAPIQHAGGVLVLLALTRWRRPEARLLVALACVPHTTLVYEALPLFLVARNLRESLYFCVASFLVVVAPLVFTDFLHPVTLRIHATGQLLVLLMYLPATLLVLRRANEGPVPAPLDRLAWRLSWWTRPLRSRLGRLRPSRET